jgi:tetratricopeptide (TPR) repeat protein
MKSALFILSFCLGTFAFGQSNYENGLKAYSKGLNYDAFVFFTMAIDKNEDLAKSYMMRGASLIQMLDFVNGSKDIDSSIILDSSNYLAFYYRGKCLFAQDLNSEAILFYNKSIDLNPDFEAQFYERGKCHMNILAFDLAINDFDNAIRVNSKEDMHYLNRGICKLELNLLEDALKDFDTALSIKTNEVTYANKGTVLFKLGRFEESITNFTIALAAEPWNDAYAYGRGMSYKAAGNIELARKDFRNSAASGNKLAKKERKSLPKK